MAEDGDESGFGDSTWFYTTFLVRTEGDENASPMLGIPPVNTYLVKI
jgi:hypothetical protein